MKTRRAARAAAAAEAESASRALHASAHEVLLSPDLWSQLWRCLDGPSKRALRRVCTELRSLVDEAVEVVASPSSGFTAESLSHALVQWAGVRDLTLLNVSSASALAPLATCSLASLKCLTLREVRHAVPQAAPVPSHGLRCLMQARPSLHSVLMHTRDSASRAP
jgi:hypothetical protein